jgi:hypothetical protein
VVVVTEAPVLETVTMNNLGNQLYLQFSEDMSEPAPTIFTDLIVYGKDIPLYSIVNISMWPLDNKRIILTLGTYIDNPNDIRIVYKGNSLTSIYGGAAPSFDFSMRETPVEDVALAETKVYPTLATTSIAVSGLMEGNQISIVSITGETVVSMIASSDVESIQISNLTAGTYYVLISEHGQIVARHSFVKK